MKTFCGFIGWMAGMFLGFALSNTIPVLAFICVIGGIFVGRYIGGCIEESKEQERINRENAQRRKIQEEQAQRKRKEEAERQMVAQENRRSLKDSSKSSIQEVFSETSHYRPIIDRDAEIKRLAAQKEAERATALRREREKKEAERAAELERLKEVERIKKSLPSKVSSWGNSIGGLRYDYLLKYYPTTCDFEACQSEWDDRWTVWNFKNTPGKTNPARHSQALDDVIPRLKSKLNSTFGQSSLKYLTLVCIPASNATKTQARYKEFSQRLCRETGMINAYDYMDVVSSSEEKKFGGSGVSTDNVSFDSSFFRGKYVILFDDVITKGESMLRFKRKMESLGATVVGGLSIGKTTHSR